MHRGHIEPLLAAKESFQWSQMLFMPAFRQPFKQQGATVSAYHRFAMLALATSGIEGAVCSPWELEKGRISYSVETALWLREQHPGATIDWVIGDDNLPLLPEWREIDRIFELLNFVVLGRGTSLLPQRFESRVTQPEVRGKAGSICFARNERLVVSSTDIRRKLSYGEPVDDLLSPEVARYIRVHQLYESGENF